MEKKRILFIALFVLVTASLGYLMYRVFFAPPGAPRQGEKKGTAGVTTPFPVSEEGKITTTSASLPGQLPTISTLPGTSLTPLAEPPPRIGRLVDGRILSVAKDTLGVARFYNQQDGRFYRVLPNGTTAPLSDEVFYNVEQVTWSPKGNQAIIEYPDGANISYNFDTKKQVTLPKHWEDFSFSPAGEKMVAKSMAVAPENRWLITSNPDGNNIQLIEPMGDNADKVIVDWSANKDVAAFSLTGAPLGAFRQEVLLVGLHGENYKSLIVEGRGFEHAWAPSGEKLIYSVYSPNTNYGPSLWVVNASGDAIGSGRKPLNIATWADKCAFADDRIVYCAVPKNLPKGVGFAPEIADSISDELYKIDTATGIKTKIETDGNQIVDSMFLASDGKNLFFTDKNKTGIFGTKL